MLTKRANGKTRIAALIALAVLTFAPLAHADTIVDPSQTSQDADLSWGWNNSGSIRSICQSFKPTHTSMTGFVARVKQVASDSNITTNSRNLVVKLLSSGCDPSGGTVVTSQTIAAADVVAAFSTSAYVEYEFDINATLTVGTTYYLNFSVSSFTSGDYLIMRDYSGGGYADGSEQRDVNGSWSSNSRDLWFKVMAEDDPVEYGVGPVATIYSPPDESHVPSYAFGGSGLEARATSDIVATSTDATNVSFDWLIFKDGVLAGFRLDQTPELTYSGGGYWADRVYFSGLDGENGRYELRARVCNGTACGVYGRSQFDVSDSSATGTADFVMPTTEPFPTWDGELSTLGTWIKDVVAWVLVPPSIWAFDPSSLFDLFQTRWPLAYVFGPIDSWQTGFAEGASCPMPEFLGNSLFGQTLPTFDLCDTLEQVAPAIEGNAFGRTTLQWVIYLFGAMTALAVARSIIKVHP